MIYTTLNRIREQAPCTTGWEKLLRHLGKNKADDEPLSYITILESIGLDDALWCCRVEPQQSKAWRLFAVECAESVRHLMEDKRSLAAIDVARRHAYGEASNEELAAARDAARDAVRAAVSALAAARAEDGAAARDAVAARVAARDAARDAAWDAAWVAAGAAAGAAAVAAARAAAWNEASADLAQVFRNIVTAHGE